MAIREDVVASAANFLQDPSVSSSPVESRIAFLRSKNLTQEEISAALARAGPAPAAGPASTATAPAYYGQHPSQYPPYAWQAAAPAPVNAPRRDWRDWFIVATVVGGVGYGLYSLGRRYVYPLIAPPTPERLVQDKQSIDEQFEKTFSLVAQLAKDTEALKEAERARTTRLDTAMADLETVIGDLKSANRRREDDAQRVRDDVQNLKDAIPRALEAQKEAADARLREVNVELRSLKTLISQRLNPPATSNSASTSIGNVTPTGAAESAESTNGTAGATAASPAAQGSQAPGKGPEATRPSPLASGTAAQGKAAIPAWQLAMTSKSAGSSAAKGSES